MEILIYCLWFFLLVGVILIVMLAFDCLPVNVIRKQKQSAPLTPRQYQPSSPTNSYNKLKQVKRNQTIPPINQSLTPSFNQFAPPPPQQPQPSLQINSNNNRQQVRPTQTTNQPLTPFSSLRPHSPQTRKLYGQMVRLLQGDSEAVNRLIDSQKSKNPDKSEEWIYEKVLFDLTRDRH
ncbi:hypothetical protein [Plectonema radiosum]|nr:hypothetical protein [Plectonema radiosum]